MWPGPLGFVDDPLSVCTCLEGGGMLNVYAKAFSTITAKMKVVPWMKMTVHRAQLSVLLHWDR